MTKSGLFIGLCALGTAAIIGVGTVTAYGASKDEGRIVSREASASHNPPTPGPSQPAPETPSPPPSSAPPPSASPSPPPPPPAPQGPCQKPGPNQYKVEEYLSEHPEYGPITVDGQQTPQDCETIKAFQRRFSISGAPGIAGPLTGQVISRLNAAATNSCQAGSSTTICVDLTSQTMWVVRDGSIVLGPTPIRTGRRGLATPAGTFTITEKKRSTISSYFKVRLPNWQRFHGDMGFHTTTTYLYDGPGSHGCINVLSGDSSTLYSMTSIGTTVHLFGAKPGP